MTGDHDPGDATAALQPARRSVVMRHAVASVVVAALLAVFLVATVALPPVGALVVGLVVAAGALWAIRRASLAAQSGLVATASGLVLRLGTASAEVGWDAVDGVAMLGAGGLVAVDVRAGRLHRRLPRAYAADDVHRWLQAAADLAAGAGRDDLRVRDGALTAAE